MNCLHQEKGTLKELYLISVRVSLQLLGRTAQGKPVETKTEIIGLAHSLS